ncbi:MAG: sulfur carrier protein ThiS [Gammaproteobacteria bacterium]|nr:MAG: sulfur carrier protein ThiS [Gammaproteobacteria bacterium]UTW42432.1 sulfur carrier protein ThiS [bacterium SCSIO 12844]
MFIQIQFNQKLIELPEDDASLEVLLITEKVQGDYFLVVINDQLVLREKYKNYCLKRGDRVDIITPMQGG